MKQWLYIFMLLLLCGAFPAACSSEPDGPSDRPGSSGWSQNGSDEAPTDEETFTDEVADSRLRFVSDTLSMVYDNGGVLYSVTGNRHRFVDITSNVAVVFDPADNFLRVNNKDANIKECKKISQQGGICWYLTLPDSALIVVENI